jgi:hypothetical protein
MAKTKRLIRSPRQPAINFAAEHVEPFTTHAAAVGITPAIASSYTSAVTKANDAQTAVNNLKQQLKVAVADANGKFREMSQSLSDVVSRIDLFAATQADPMVVYNLAALLPPTDPSQQAEPGTPDTFRATLNPSGSVRVAWKCKNPEGSQGTVYIVRRKLNNSTQWQQVALTASRFYVDGTIPAASGGAQYTVQGQRGNVLGEASAPFTLQFGVDGGGNFAILSQELKAAA